MRPTASAPHAARCPSRVRARAIALSLAFGVSLWLGPPAAEAATAPADDAATLTAGQVRPQVEVPEGASKERPVIDPALEIIEERDQFRKVYRVPGSPLDRIAEVGVTPVHYRDANGRWAEVDTTLRRRADGTFALTENAFQVVVREQLRRKSLAEVQFKGRTLTLGEDLGLFLRVPEREDRSLFTRTDGTKGLEDTGRIAYRGALGGDLEFEVGGETLSQKLRLPSAPYYPEDLGEERNHDDATLVFHETMRLSAGVDVRLDGASLDDGETREGALLTFHEAIGTSDKFRDERGARKGDILFQAAPPVAFEEDETGVVRDDGGATNPDDNITDGWYRVTRRGRTLRVEKLFSARWFVAPERQYPVVLDPTLEPTILVENTWFHTGVIYRWPGSVGGEYHRVFTAGSAHYAAYTGSRIRLLTISTTQQMKAWLRFNIAGLYRYIQSVQYIRLQLYMDYAHNSTSIGFNDVNLDVCSYDTSGQGQTLYSYIDGGTRYSTLAPGPLTNQWHTFDICGAAYAKVINNRAANVGYFNIGMELLNEIYYRDVRFHDRQHGNRPRLIIRYTVECTSSSQCNDNVPCTDNVCNSGRCEYPITAGYCYISGSCYSNGATRPGVYCQGCNTSYSTTAWWTRTNWSCNDGNACTHTDRCRSNATCSGTAYSCADAYSCTTDTCNGAGGCSHTINGGTCLISGTCYNRYNVNPANPCQECLDYWGGAYKTQWAYDNSNGCNDGNVCTHTDRCVSGSCTGTGYSCNDGRSCTNDYCNGAGGCTYTLVPGSCLIGGTCYSNGQLHPTNPCQSCQSSVRTNAWSNEPNGTHARSCWPCSSGGPTTGICHRGTQTCQSGTYGACGGYQCPVSESCNNQDDDCDGSVDEGNPGSGASCNTLLAGSACDAGVTDCRDHALECFPNVGGFGSPSSASVPAGLMDRSNGGLGSDHKLVTTDGRFMYNLAYSCGAGYNGYRIRKFELDAAGNTWNLVDRWDHCGIGSLYIDGIVATPQYLYAIEWNGSTASQVVRFNTVTKTYDGRTGWMYQAHPHRYISGQYDWVNDRVWMGSLTTNYVAYWNLGGSYNWNPQQSNWNGTFQCSGVGGAGVLGTDGTHLYVKRWSSYPGDDYLRRCGTGTNGAPAGENFGRATTWGTANGLTGFYHSDGYYYSGSSGSPYTIQRTRVTAARVEDCDGVDDNCSGVADEVCDRDNDNYCDATLPRFGTPATCTAGGGDCDDWTTARNPGYHEVCDTIDHDCDGQIYEDYAEGCVPFWEDVDGDWYGSYAILDEGPTGYWTMDDRWGDSVWDASGRGHHAIRRGSTNFTAGRIADAADFHNGSGDYLEVPHHAELQPTNKMTIEAWMYPRARPSGYANQIVHKATSTSNATIAWYFFGSNGLLQPYMSINGGWIGCGGFYPPLNQWTHVAVTFDGAWIRTYRNGAEVGSCYRAGNLGVNTAPLTIGKGWQNPQNGKLDEVAFFRDALPAHIIRKHMEVTRRTHRCFCLGAETPPYTTIFGWDCNDANISINPDAAETCDGVDQDCDGTTDEGTDSQCADAYSCTTDTCGGGSCQHTIQANRCLISGVCYSTGSPNGQCNECQPAQSTSSWTYMTNKGCNDGNACTHTDRCAAGGVGCRGTAYSCNDGRTCTTDVCNGAGGCTNTINPGTCLIGGTCYANGATNPGNPCQWCVAAASNTGWTNKPSGAACTADAYSCTDDVCNGGGGCTHPIQSNRCLISGTCYSNGANNPGNECQRCWASTTKTSWTNKPSGMGCTDDGKSCTSDICNGGGSCLHPVNGGLCLIDGTCYSDGATNGACQECEPAVNKRDWTYMSGKVCNDGVSCTHTDRCIGGASGATALQLALDEGNDTFAGDTSGNGNHGTLTGGSTWTTGHEAMGVRFNGQSGSYIDVPDAAELTPSRQLTVALWVRPDAGMSCNGWNNWRYLVAKGGWGSYHLIFEQGYSIGWTVRVNGADQRLWTAHTAPANTWTHVAVTYDAANGSQRTYINGNPSSSRTGVTGTITAYPGTPLRIGSYGGTVACPNGGGAFPGVVDDVLVYGRALSPAEIQTLYANSASVPPCAGSAYSCDDSLSCTADTCLGNGSCTNTIVAGRCLIGGTCYLHGQTNPANECQQCNTSVSSTAWTAKSNGTACTDEGLSCTADYCISGSCTHNILSGRCLIGGTCYNRSQRNPSVNCQWCWDPTSKTAWTNTPSGQSCTADAYSCTNDVCNGGGGCTHPIQTDKCLIGGTCYNDLQTRPGVECEWCAASTSHTAWTDKPTSQACSSDGLTCTSDYCNGGGTCAHTLIAGNCLIGSRCYAHQANNPANECTWCNTSASTSVWTNKPNGMSCTPDAYACTYDTCNGGGACTHPVQPTKCLISGTCYSDGAPNGMCRECEPSVSRTNWTYMTGKVCNDSNDCSHTDRCKPGFTNDTGCDGTDYSCDDSLTCTADQCLGDGTCRNRLINGYCLIGGVCYGNKQTNPGNECQWCDPAASTGAWTNKPSGVVCSADAYPCTNDVCNGGGACVHPTQSDKCLISNTCYSQGQDRPGVPCQECTPAQSQTAWSNVPPNTVSQQCYPCGVSAPGVGECDWGIQWCTGGSWGACANYTCPVAEQCDNKDNDCDAATDEEVDLGYTTCGLGECDHTIDNCVGGVTQVCDPLEGSVAESCDSLDNDCDGRTDETFSIIDWNGSTRFIGEGCGTGACAGGTVVCRGDGLGAECSTWGNISTETCDGSDEDCDGQIDDNTDHLCADAYTCTTDRCVGGSCTNPINDGTCLIAGVCRTDHEQRPGTPCQECSSALSKTTWSNVPPGTRQQPCWPCSTGGDPDVGECNWGTQWCAGGTWGACGGHVCAVADSCNAKDDDCDGQTDEVIPDDGIACTIDGCVGGVEQHPIESDKCLIGGACYPGGAVSPTNNCEVCFPAHSQTAWSDTLLQGGFEADLGGFVVADVSGGGVTWQRDTARAFSGARSLYFGKPATHTYAAGANRARATATSGWITLPNSVVNRLSFMLWLDTEEFTAAPEFDILRVWIEAQGSPAAEAWNSWTTNGGTTNGVFERVMVDLSLYAGRTVRVIYEFDSGDGNFNGYEGAYIDDVQVETACCSSAADCNDGVSCTQDSCAGGMCQYVNECSTCLPRMRNVAFDVDRSASMAAPPTPGPTAKWSILVQAMTNVLGSYEDLLNMALNIYPIGSSCTFPTGLELPFHSAGDEITDYLAGANPLGDDAMAASLAELGAVYGASTLGGDRYVVVITDGTEECGGDPVAAAANLYSQGVVTYVIGFGDAVDDVLLTDLAEAGGRPLPTPSPLDRPYFYATDLNGLETALEAVLDRIYGEECNNLDDDCDTSVDEGVPPIGCNFACLGGVGGQRTCAAGVWSDCSVVPTSEVCDGVDNDCDGLTDADDPDLLDNDWPACALQQGVCSGARKPAELCVGGVWLDCGVDEYMAHDARYAVGEGTTCGPEPCCDGVDNDCDGATDESMGQTTCGLGHCAHTTDNCQGGVVVLCNPFEGAQPEICDGTYDEVNDIVTPIDNDCDGVANEVPDACDWLGPQTAPPPGWTGEWDYRWFDQLCTDGPAYGNYELGAPWPCFCGYSKVNGFWDCVGL